jgi:hypothetical protein
MIASDYYGGNPMGGKPLKTDEGLGYGPVGRPGSMKHVPGVYNEIRVNFNDPIDNLFEGIINVLFSLIDAVGGNFCVSGITQMGIR